MSFDLAVWYSDFRMSADDAGSFYRHINGDWVVAREHPAIREFCRALMTEFPGILDPADLERDFLATPTTHLLTYADLVARPSALFPASPPQSPEEPPPWRIIASFQGLAMTMSLGSRRSEIGPAIRRLAGTHGLIGYDPQTGDVAIPPRLAGMPCQPLPEPVRMMIAEKPENLDIRISFEGRVLFEGCVSSRREAHDLARDHAIELGRLAYAVEDKWSLSSAYDRPSPPMPTDHPILELLKKMPLAPLMSKGED
jgi:hypothetical protein